ncbi:MAG: glycoside hydrolase family 127 protein [Bacteroidales bacterium]|nr:glycoside hydrolase family 127 protein [Bacteroidales bacterium]
MRRLPILTVLSAALLAGAASCTTEVTEKRIKTDGPEVVDFRVLPFDLSQVTLLEGEFEHATELNKKILLDYEPDRLLATFRLEAGLEPKAEHYGGWEDYPRRNLNGHSLGHYMTALTLMYKSSGEQEFLDRLNYIIDELAIIQEADGDGYIGALPGAKKVFEEEVAKGEIRSAGFDLNGYWAPFYIHHKVLAGLNDAYLHFGNEKALEISIRFADWISSIVDHLEDDDLQEMLHCEHGGINESFAELYAITGEERFLNTARVFHHKAILDPLANGEDILPGKHANTQIPKLIGLARLYELTGNETDRMTAEYFWDRVVNHHSYVTGGNGNNEYFGEPDQLNDRLGQHTTETCNVYNMLKLSEHLFEWDGSPVVADFYERALLNHIHSSQHPETGRVIYNLTIDMGGYKTYQNPEHFTCCVGSGMENHSKYGANIFYHNDEELFLFQYIASELNWEENGLRVRMNTDFPNEQGATLEFLNEEEVPMTLQIRYPYWAEKGITITVNGKKKRVRQEPGSFVPVSGKWKKGDVVRIDIPFSLRTEAMPDNPKRIAIMYGPLVLAGDLGEVRDPAANEPMYVPVIMADKDNLNEWLIPVEDKVNTFMMTGAGQPRDVELKPFYSTHDRRFTIYWDLFTQEEWDALQEEYQRQEEYKLALESKTIDFAQPGEMQPERDHNFQGENSTPTRYNGRAGRESRGGWFSFDMKVNPDSPNALVVDYWGGFPGSKTFDILVSDKVIATENISNKKDGEFIDVTYEIPEDLTVGKFQVTVKFRAHEGHMAGPLYGVRIIRNE